MSGIASYVGGYKQITATGNVCPFGTSLLGIFVSSSSSGTITIYDSATTTTTTKVIDTVLRKALDDEDKDQVACLKMCLDRMLPVSMFEKDSKGQRNTVQINITGLGETKIEASEIIDTDITDVEYSDGTE